MKQQKGITLVALVITIIVLLILAGVALATVAQGNIVDNAEKAVNEYNASVGNDETVVTEVDNLLNKYFTQYYGTNK